MSNDPDGQLKPADCPRSRFTDIWADSVTQALISMPPRLKDIQPAGAAAPADNPVAARKLRLAAAAVVNTTPGFDFM
jgi:hypothetical protein